MESSEQAEKSSVVESEEPGKSEQTTIIESDAASTVSGMSSVLRETAAPREVTAATIGRMMGLATNSDLKLLEGKMDLLSTRLASMSSKIERLGNLVQNGPTGSDLERIDVQIGALRTMIRETMEALSTPVQSDRSAVPQSSEDEKPVSRSSRIVSSSDEAE